MWGYGEIIDSCRCKPHTPADCDPSLLFGVPKEGAWGVLATKFGSSVINAVFAVIISMVLMYVINKRPEIRRQVDEIN